MRLHELSPGPHKNKSKKRKGRGISSGLGKTAGRGHKGQNARSGGGVRPGFEGGQMPLQERVPKRGFKNRFAREFAEVNLDRLNQFEEGAVITPETLLEEKIIKRLKDGVKILGEGKLEKALTIKAHKFSQQAREKIEAAGGKAEVI